MGHVEADNPVDAWAKAREIYEATGSMVYDVRQEIPKETLLRLSGITPHEMTEEERMMEEWEKETKIGGHRLPIGVSAVLDGIIKGYRAEFRISLRKEEDCAPEFWDRMGRTPFYAVSMFDSYTGQSVEGYISVENLRSLLKRMEF